MTDAKIRHSEEVAFRVIDGSAVLVTSNEAALYWLNPVATRIWELADGSRRATEISDAICEEFEVDGERALSDVNDMIAAFVEKQLLTQNA